MKDKTELRKQFKTLRNSIVFRAEKDCQIREKVLKLFEEVKPSSVFSYISMNGEVDTRSIIAQIMGKIPVFVPFTNEENMVTVMLEHYDGALTVDKRGNLFSVASDSGITPQITLTPLLAFNNELYRLGYGGGYYDKYFARNDTLKVGLGYDEQETDCIFTEKHDIPLDLIITPTRIIRRSS